MITIILNFLGYGVIGISLLAGFLVVDKNPKIKLFGVCLYIIPNLYALLMWRYAALNCYLVSSLVFLILTFTNIFRVSKQIIQQKGNKNEYKN